MWDGGRAFVLRRPPIGLLCSSSGALCGKLSFPDGLLCWGAFFGHFSCPGIKQIAINIGWSLGDGLEC